MANPSNHTANVPTLPTLPTILPTVLLTAPQEKADVWLQTSCGAGGGCDLVSPAAGQAVSSQPEERGQNQTVAMNIPAAQSDVCVMSVPTHGLVMLQPTYQREI